MGYTKGYVSGKILNGSKLVIPGKGVSIVNPGGDTKINKPPKTQNNN